MNKFLEATEAVEANENQWDGWESGQHILDTYEIVDEDHQKVLETFLTAILESREIFREQNIKTLSEAWEILKYGMPFSR